MYMANNGSTLQRIIELAGEAYANGDLERVAQYCDILKGLGGTCSHIVEYAKKDVGNMDFYRSVLGHIANSNEKNT